VLLAVSTVAPPAVGAAAVMIGVRSGARQTIAATRCPSGPPRVLASHVRTRRSR
jgi:hypothetical protein